MAKIDPTKKASVVIKKSSIPTKGVLSGSGQKLSRDSTGVLRSTQGANFAGQSNQSMKADRKVAAGTGNGHFQGSVAPRVGGSLPKPAGKVVNYGNSSAINKKNIGKLKKK